MESKLLWLDEDVTVIRTRRRTISISITPRGSILVRCPEYVPDSSILRQLNAIASWIQTQREKHPPLVEDPLSRDELKELHNLAREDLTMRTNFYAPIVGVSYHGISIKCQKTRWGSCSTAGHLNYNCLLMLAPPDVRDYVVVHELCHLLEMNHSPAFWKQVSRVYPDYQNCRDWLNQYGRDILARRPEHKQNP